MMQLEENIEVINRRALMTIRKNFAAWGLQAEHGTFEAYCKSKWSMSNRHANRLIEACEVVDQVGPIGPKPTNENQARALAAAPPEKRAEIWQEAVETAPHGKVTARHIKEVVNRATGWWPWCSCSWACWCSWR